MNDMNTSIPVVMLLNWAREKQFAADDALTIKDDPELADAWNQQTYGVLRVLEDATKAGLYLHPRELDALEELLKENDRLSERLIRLLPVQG